MNILKNDTDNKKASSNDFINTMNNLLDNGGTPKTVLKNISNKNYNIFGAMEYLQTITQNKNPKDLAIQMARTKGIDIDELMNLANRMGLK